MHQLGLHVSVMHIDNVYTFKEILFVYCYIFVNEKKTLNLS